MNARLTGMASALGLHAVMVTALLAYEPARSALLASAPIMVDWVLPPQAPKPPEPKIEPPKPRPVARPPVPRPVEPPPVITAAAEAPSPVVAPPSPPPSPPAPIEAPPPVAAPAPAPFVPPVFDADYLDNPPPVFPAISRRMGEQGRVILRVLVSPGGGAAEVQVRSSSGHDRLDHAAREAVRRWKFVPARRGEQAVSAWVLIPISFRLEG
ncbi:MAG: energy transducer TonB [Betaproteobacteria bacterium]